MKFRVIHSFYDKQRNKSFFTGDFYPADTSQARLTALMAEDSEGRTPSLVGKSLIEEIVPASIPEEVEEKPKRGGRRKKKPSVDEEVETSDLPEAELEPPLIHPKDPVDEPIELPVEVPKED
ncbi:MAG: hypothetical protein LBV67_11685 [Streptococcaceae bacterium]|jgi:hypothetical protein|nr:hypothetical protein [Streptococcaceae bacterium]